MKIVWYSLAVLLVAGMAQAANKVVVTNNSGFTCEVTAVYPGCAQKKQTIQNGSTETISDNGCCLSWINARITNGAPTGKVSKNVAGSSTGAGMSCKSNSFVITLDKGFPKVTLK